MRDGILRAASLSSALIALACLGGALSGWLDVLNSFAPEWALLGILVCLLAGRAGRAALSLALFGAIVPLCQMAPDCIAAARDALRPSLSSAPGSLKLVSFNVWDENFAPRQAIDLILRQNADLVGLEESGPAFEQDRRLRRLYPNMIHCTEVEAGGCSLWSKRPFLAKGELMPAPYGMAAIWGRVIAPDGRPVTVLAVHLARPYRPRIKWLQMDALADYVERLGPEETILAGDFNQTPWSFGMRHLDEAMQPLTRHSHALFTWPAYLEAVGLHMPFGILPIDHIYAAPAFARAALRRLPASSSDHFGVVAVFAPRAGP